MKDSITVSVTGGAGQVAYSLLFRVASGEVFGPDQPVNLIMKEVPEFAPQLEGVKMELEDCAFPTLRGIAISDSDETAFKGANWVLLVGATPRKPGMERKDLLAINGASFRDQGIAINKTAASDVRIVVVGNPCNTNCLIAMKHAPDIPHERFSALTRLDENRAKAQLSLKTGATVDDITRLAIWGNHSTTMYPDFEHALFGGRSVEEAVGDRAWLEGPFVETIQKRGAAILAARGKSSAASAANATIDHVKSAITPAPEGTWFSAGILSDGNEYGIPEGLIFSFPCRSNGTENYRVVNGLDISAYARQKLEATANELIAERADVQELL